MGAAPAPPQMAHVSDYHDRSRASYNTSPFPTSDSVQHPYRPWPGSSHDSVLSSPSTLKSGTHQLLGSPSARSSVSASTNARHGGRDSTRDSIRAGSVYITRPDDSMLGREQYPESSRRHEDLEKQASSPASDPFRTPGAVPNAHITKMTYGPDEEAEDLEAKSLRILIYLSAPCTLVSFGLTIWTFVAIIIAILLQPLRMCARRQSFMDELNDLLGPPLRLQLRLIYSFASADKYNTSMLLLVNLLAPILSCGVAIAAWTAACFWFYAAIIGDPPSGDNQRREKRNDGRETVLEVRNWWEGWLIRAYR